MSHTFEGQAFKASLLDPFNPTSLGCKVPDPYCFPTNTTHLHGNVVTKVGAATGSLVFLPCPVVSLIDVAHAATSVGVIDTTASVVTRFTNNHFLFQATSGNTLNTICANYRVVSWGIKISNLQPEMTATGRLIIYPIPVNQVTPGEQLFENRACNGNQITNLLVDQNTALMASSNVLNFPGAFEVVVQDLLHGDIQMAGTPITPTFWDFKASNNNEAYGGFTFGDQFLLTGTTPGTGIDEMANSENSRMEGGMALGMFWEGCPTTGNNFNIEVIYHLEGTPKLSTDRSVPVE
jgi:hypothetical protein